MLVKYKRLLLAKPVRVGFMLLVGAVLILGPYLQVTIDPVHAITTHNAVCEDEFADLDSDCIPQEQSGYCELTITKSDQGNDPVVPGTELEYYLTLENTGTADCTGGGVKLEDLFDKSKLQYLRHVLGGTYPSEQAFVENNSVLRWNFATVQPGEKREVWVTFAVKESLSCGAVITNKLRSYAKETGWSDFIIEQTAVDCSQQPTCEIAFEKTANKTSVAPGDDLQYTVSLTNTGDKVCTGSGVQMKDTFDSNTGLESWELTASENFTPEQPHEFGANNEYAHLNYGKVTPGHNRIATFDMTVSNEAVCDSTLVNTACFYAKEYKDAGVTDPTLGAGWTCIDVETPVICSEPVCGNGIVESGEQCDDGNLVNGDGCDQFCAVETFDIELTKTVNNAFVAVGDTVTFTIIADTVAQAGGSNITIADELPSELSLVTNSATTTAGTFDESTMIWTIGDMAALTSETLTFDAVVTQAGSFVNMAQVMTHDQLDVDSTPGNDDVFEDDQDTAEVTASENQPYCGDGIINQATESCDLGANNGLSCSPEYGNSCSYCSESCTTIVIDGPFCGDGVVQSDEGEECDEGANNGAGTCSAQCTLVAQDAFDIELTKSVNNNAVAPGSDVTFTVTVLNNSLVDATGVTVEDRMPAELVFIANSATTTAGTFDESTMIWTIGDLGAGSSTELTFDATVTTEGTFVNTAELITYNETDIDSTAGNNVADEDDQDTAAVEAIGGNGGPQCGNGIVESGEQCDDGNANNGDGCSNQCIIETTGCVGSCGGGTSRPRIVITKTAGAAFTNPDSIVPYTIEVTNTRSARGRDLVVTDVLPAGLEYASSTMTGVWNLGDISKNEIKTITYDVYVPATTTAGMYTNTATATISNGNSAIDDAVIEVRVPSVLSEKFAPVLAIEKTADRSFSNPNGQVVYTVTVTNIDARETAKNVTMVDRLPKEFYFIDTDTYVRSWSLGDLPAGQSETITYTVGVLGDTADGVYTNIATASADNAPDVHDTEDVEVRTVTIEGFTLPDTNGAHMILLYLLTGGLLMALAVMIKKYREIDLYNV